VTALLWFAIGAVAGSAANAVIYRLPRGVSWFSGHSFCPKCKHSLSLFDLVPIFSYLFLRGRCRYCRSPIPIRYLLVELFLGVAFTISYLSNLGSLSYLMIWVTTVIAVMDWETMLVSDWLVALWGGLVFLSYLGNLSDLSYLWGAAVAVGVIGGIWMISKGKAMGSGDIGIAAVAGYWLGWPKIGIGLWVAFVVGGVIGVIGVIRGIRGMKSKIAFGPFLILGTWVGYVWGDKILTMIFKYHPL